MNLAQKIEYIKMNNGHIPIMTQDGVRVAYVDTIGYNFSADLLHSNFVISVRFTDGGTFYNYSFSRVLAEGYL